MTSDRDPTPTSGGGASRDADGAGLDPRWVEAMRRHGGTPADDATWRTIVDRAEDPTPVPSTGGLRMAPRLAWAAAAAVVALVVGAAAVIALGDSDSDGGDAEQVQAGPSAVVGAAAEEWERLSDPPLSPRDGVMSAWTGEELLVFGGTTWTCPPGADCVGPDADQELGDGAAINTETGKWRSIRSLPEPMAGAPTAVVGDDLHVLDRSTNEVWRYSIPGDNWFAPIGEPAGLSSWDQLVAAGTRVVAVAGSDSTGQDEDDLSVLDEPGGEWRALTTPEDVLPLMYDRVAVWSDPYLYVFGKEIVEDPGVGGPSLVIGARVDLETEEWERLPDSEILDPPWIAADGLLVSPDPGGADGGEVNSWGRTYPNGGIFDTATQTWRDLPEAPPGYPAGVIGSTTASYWGTGGSLLDATTGRWTSMPPLSGDEASPDEPRIVDPHQVHTAGMDAVAFGGADWSGDDEADLLGDAWIWRSGRSPSSADDGETAGTEGTDVCGYVDEEGAGGKPCPPDDAATSGDEVEYFVAATVLDDGGGPELCLGGVATSLPPQCGGPPIEGWDWATVEGEETAAGTTWGEFEVIGTYDGTTFTLTEEPRPVDPSDDPELLDEPLDIDPDFTAPCPEPEGGWPVADPAAWGIDELNTFLAEARLVEGFTGIWMDDAPGDQQAGGGAGGIYVVAVAGGSGVEAGAEAALRDLWGGAICVTDAERTYRELEQAQDEARALVEESGETLLVSAIDEAGNRVHVQVIAPAPELQTELDERLGEGTVVLSSALRRLA